MPVKPVMPIIVSLSMYSTRRGPTPLITSAGTARVTSASERKGASTVDHIGMRGKSFTVTLVTTASVPSDPMSSCVRS